MASTNLDNDVMQQDFVFEDEENDQVRNAKIKNSLLDVLDVRLIVHVFF